jgi:hypothetical protein
MDSNLYTDTIESRLQRGLEEIYIFDTILLPLTLSGVRKQ